MLHQRSLTDSITNTSDRTACVPAVDAVYALAHSLHNMLVARCGGITLCKEVQPVPDGQQLLKHIRNVSFIGETRR